MDGRGGLSLSEIASLIEIKHERKKLVEALRELIYPLKPTGGLLDLPIYPWRDIYTTNYDSLIEKSFAKRNLEYSVISTNFDFEKISEHKTSIFKIHGTIDKDSSDGSMSRLIITEQDYLVAEQYREDIYGRLLSAGSTANLLVIGHSLADADLNAIIQEAVRRRTKSGSIGRVYALVYERDENRALLVEQRGVRVAFGGLDELASALAEASPNARNSEPTGNPVNDIPGLSATVVDVVHSVDSGVIDAARMFYGSAASYADIRGGLTFQRDIALTIEHLISQDNEKVVMLMGVAGVGKTTVMRQVLVGRSNAGYNCWEHIDGASLAAEKWLAVDSELAKSGSRGILFVDDAHKYISEIGRLVDGLATKEESALSIVLCSSKAHWNHRTKSDGLYLLCRYLELRRLTANEIDHLLDLLERDARIATLAEKDFSGFSRFEKRRRLIDRCSSDFFVCLRNIFSTEILDEIILREYAQLSLEQQQVYRVLSALEASGILPHRQSIVRAVGLSAEEIGPLLESMDGMIEERDFDPQHGIYTWHGRHPVISEIIRRTKYSDADQFLVLLESFVDHVNPSYEIERHNLIEACDQGGIGRVASKESQNFLFRKIISKAPTLRVPRHRLISNLINSADYEQAGNEIRIFESDLSIDGPVTRLKALLLMRRAQTAKGLLAEDKVSLVTDAAGLLASGIARFKNDRRLYETYCDAGMQLLKLGGGWATLDDALELFTNKAEDTTDPEFARSLRAYKMRVAEIQAGR